MYTYLFKDRFGRFQFVEIESVISLEDAILQLNNKRAVQIDSSAIEEVIILEGTGGNSYRTIQKLL